MVFCFRYAIIANHWLAGWLQEETYSFVKLSPPNGAAPTELVPITDIDKITKLAELLTNQKCAKGTFPLAHFYQYQEENEDILQANGIFI